MTEEEEMWACAAEVLRQHGDQSQSHVAERIGDLALKGDMRGVAIWRAIAQRLDRLTAPARLN